MNTKKMIPTQLISRNIYSDEMLLNEVIIDFIANAEHLVPKAQEAIASYITMQTHPTITVNGGIVDPKGTLQ